MTYIDNNTGENPGIVGKGDSMMQGPGSGQALTDHLRRIYPYRDIKNFGVGGQTWQQVFARHGSHPSTVVLNGGSITGLTEVDLTITPQLSSTPADVGNKNLSGSINGVPVMVKRSVVSGSEIYKVTSAGMPLTQSIADNSLFIPDQGFSSRVLINIFWVGRNNPSPWTGLIDAYIEAVDYLYSPRRYLIIGILPKYNEPLGANNRSMLDNFNLSLLEVFGDRFISSDPPTQKEMLDVDYTPTPQDLVDINNGLFPTGVRSPDGTHLLSVGQKIMANRCAKKINQFNW